MKNVFAILALLAVVGFVGCKEETKNSVKKAGDDVKKEIKEAGDKAADKVKETGDKVADGVKAVGDKVEEKVDAAAEGGKKALEDVKDAVKGEEPKK